MPPDIVFDSFVSFLRRSSFLVGEEEDLTFGSERKRDKIVTSAVCFPTCMQDWLGSLGTRGGNRALLALLLSLSVALLFPKKRKRIAR